MCNAESAARTGQPWEEADVVGNSYRDTTVWLIRGTAVLINLCLLL
jgi:hypothetical protein